ncbi:hypothetical protein H257_09840 [Aphanomyces astaci]|uniref:SET domain-containing protein n=1 Tax=Aphanomyces astaci TaxID=112090 RepID=W4G866_APHAT|nr:hypothetical protein H257_09840 [Aphanomyces astaci]ETV75870.1 hypothetical protein H257_09840 [Aphanomyces astaci]RQM28573.1 hypothetical protein B5M09_010860 [Aphanomyces astaci]|eukprot:XP_009834512.1 hypothetical protein H257_09840 [Aphanomyces astaci]
MEFDAPTFLEAPVSQDMSKPIVATSALTAGQVIFAEAATVASAGGMEPEQGFHEEDCEDEECDGCAAIDESDDALEDVLDESEHDEVSAYVVAHFSELTAACESFEALGASEVRKNLFKVFHLIEVDAKAIDSFLSLDVVADDVAATLDAATGLRDAHPSAIPTSLTTDQVAHLIGVLHKHSIPLEDIGGSGLFFFVSKLKHSCTPNASYTDAGDAIWVTAIQPIAVGEQITVDFFDTHYMCAAERKQVLTEEGHACACGVCSGTAPDLTRGFKCQVPTCPTGIVHPTNSDVFACTTCDTVWDAATVAAAVKAEDTLLTELEVDSVEQMLELVQNSPLHPFHHIFYSALAVLLEDSVAEQNMTEPQALALMTIQADALNYVVPFPHSEKVSVYDSIAQAHVEAGDIAKATEAYALAYQTCINVFGPESKTSVMFKGLVDNTPTNAAEIAAAYGFDVDDDDDE